MIVLSRQKLLLRQMLRFPESTILVLSCRVPRIDCFFDAGDAVFPAMVLAPWVSYARGVFQGGNGLLFFAKLRLCALRRCCENCS